MNIYMIVLVASVLIAAFAQILLKKGAEKHYDSWLREYLNVFVICGYGLMFLSMVITTFAYSGLDYTNVPVVESLGYVFVLILSYLFFREKVTKQKVLGIAIILLGIVVYHCKFPF